MRGQAALEFISTYGWALLAILAIISVFAYVGVMNPRNYVPDSCVVTDGFHCEEAQFQLWEPGIQHGAEASVIIKNNMDKVVIIPENAMMQYKDYVGNINCGRYRPVGDSSVGERNTQIKPGERVEIVCNPGGATAHIPFDRAGEKAKMTFEFNYSFIGSSFIHTVRGEIVGEVLSRR